MHSVTLKLTSSFAAGKPAFCQQRTYKLYNRTNIPKNVKSSTVKRRLCESGQYGRIDVQKPLLRK